jgi:predicted ribosomally synthesized peptide with SipW-like signal peptide
MFEHINLRKVKNTMKKKVLMSSIVTIALCLTLIAGSTYALFTDSDTVNVAVTSGTVDVVATASDFTYESTLGYKLPQSDYKVEGNQVTLQYMVPGDYVEFYINIENKSNVAVDYRPVIALVEDGGLWSGLVVHFYGEDGTEVSGGVGAYNELAAGTTQLRVVIEFPADRGNEYQNKGCTFSYTVEAIQANHDGK